MVAYAASQSRSRRETASEGLPSTTASADLAERTSDVDLSIAYEVTGAPGGKVRYTLRFDHGTTTLTVGVSDAPVSFSLDYDSAAAIARGDLAAQAAFMQGRLKLVGDVNVLIRDGAVLDGITDPRNLGAVIRSVAAFGGHGVLIPQRRSASVTAVAWRTSAGAAARLPVAQAPNLTRTLKDWAKAGAQIVGLDTEGAVSLDDYDGTGPTVVVVGSEGKGLSRLVRETCDSVLAIPMAGDVESLNASVAAGVVLADFARQRRQS